MLVNKLIKKEWNVNGTVSLIISLISIWNHQQFPFLAVSRLEGSHIFGNGRKIGEFPPSTKLSDCFVQNFTVSCLRCEIDQTVTHDMQGKVQGCTECTTLLFMTRKQIKLTENKIVHHIMIIIIDVHHWKYELPKINLYLNIGSKNVYFAPF